MPIQNYLRPLWHNGPHVVHDASSTVRTAFELLFKGKPRRQTESVVQLHRVRPLDVTVAWLEIEVAMPVEGTGLSYRRARYLHAFAADGPGQDEITARRARALFEDVYGEDLVAGVHEAQRSLIGFDHPAGSAQARLLFVGERRQVVEARAPRDVGPVAGIGRDDLEQPVRPDVGASHRTDAIFRDVDLEPPVLDVRAMRIQPTPVEVFDRVLAARHTLDVGPGPAARHPEPPALERRADEAEDAPETTARTGESASLSTLLRARMVQHATAGEPRPVKSARPPLPPLRGTTIP